MAHNRDVIRNSRNVSHRPYQPPTERLRVKAVAGVSQDGLLFGVVALTEPVWTPQVRNAGLGTTTRPERGAKREWRVDRKQEPSETVCRFLDVTAGHAGSSLQGSPWLQV